MDFNKVTKLQLQQEFTKLQQENASLAYTNNYFASNLTAIEQILVKAPFINTDGKFFKKLVWVITNFNSIKTLIEEIYTLIKLWRERITEAQQKQAANVN